MGHARSRRNWSASASSVVDKLTYVDIERGAESSLVADGSAAGDVVGGQSLERDVGVGTGGCVEILENLSVSAWGDGGLSRLVEWWVREEGIDGIRDDLGSVPIWLRGALVFRVDCENGSVSDLEWDSCCSARTTY